MSASMKTQSNTKTTRTTQTKRTTQNNDLVDELARPEWLSEDRWPFALRRFRHVGTDGQSLDIHFTDEGTGPTLVFVHAGMWSFIWRDTIAALTSDFRCITVDFPATGLSGGSADDIDLTTYPGILNSLLDHRRVERATFVVHDLGGMVGVLAAGQAPDRVEGLVATNSFAWAPDRLPFKAMLRIMGSRPITAGLGTFRVIPRMARTKAGVGRHFEADDRQAFFGPYRQRRTSRDFHRTMRSAARSRSSFEKAEAALSGPLRRLPVMTVFGQKNDPFNFEARWKSLFPNATGWVVDGGNHFPMCDDPEGYVTRLRSWHRHNIGSNAQPALHPQV